MPLDSTGAPARAIPTESAADWAQRGHLENKQVLAVADALGTFDAIAENITAAAEEGERVIAAIESRNARELDAAIDRFEAYAVGAIAIFRQTFGR